MQNLREVKRKYLVYIPVSYCDCRPVVAKYGKKKRVLSKQINDDIKLRNRI